VPAARETRKLSAILAADMVGYSRLVAADEAGTIARLKAHRREVIEPAVAKHRGRIVKTTGDGVLAEFASVVDAVACAVEMQQRGARANVTTPPGRKLEFRIGVNLGDVIVDGDDILGDGVNIAARLEGIADPGGIVISRAARDQVQDKLPLALDDLGEVEVKNIPRPVHAFRVRVDTSGHAKPTVSIRAPVLRRPALAALAVIVVLAAGMAWWQQWSAPVPPPQVAQAPASASAPAALVLPQLPTAIAPQVAGERAALIVLPFDNLSGDPAQEYFSDGITEDITTALARFPGFLVMARNTAFTFKGRAMNAQSMGRDLGVRYMLEGSVQKQGERLRLNAQLIETASGNHVWAERFDRPLGDVFMVQDELSDRIVGTVAAHLRRREGERALRASLETLDAYDLTMRARRLTRASGHDNHLEARRLAGQAIERDPDYARAHAMLSLIANAFYSNRWNEEFGSAATLERQLAAAARAVALDPHDALIRAIHAIALTGQQRFDEAIAEAEQTLALGPNDSEILSGVAAVLQRAGRNDTTVEVLHRAVRLDPFIQPGVMGGVLATAFYLLGRYPEAAEAATYCIRRAPDATNCHLRLVAALGQTSSPSAAAAVAELMRVSPGNTVSAERRRMAATWRYAADVERLAEGLRKAGMPE
jgi:adenylate cyclase